VKITQAIRNAENEHVVYFLLTAYVETLGYYDPLRSSLPEHVKALPICGLPDVAQRLSTVQRLLERRTEHDKAGVLEEAADVLAASAQRLRALQDTADSIRRRRLHVSAASIDHARS
jgi:hypothetical protein